MPLRILAISSYKDTWNSVRPEGEMLIALARAGALVTVMTQGDAEYAARFHEAGLGVIDFHPRQKFSLSAVRRIRAELKSGGYDIVYCFNNKSIANTVWAAIGLPVKVVTYRGQSGNISRFDPSCYLTHLHPRVDAIICVADAVRRDVLAQSRLGPDRVVTIYKGHEPEWYADVQAADLTPLGIPANAPVAVCVANARPRKGVALLIEAFHRLPDNGWQLLLVGGGMDSAEFQSLVASGPAASRIHVAGFRRNVLQVVKACHIGVLPTIKREGLPKTVIEAMALGLPVVVTDSGGSQELVVEGETGYVVPAGDIQALARALAQLMASEERRRTMGDAARDHLFRHFTAQQAGSQTLVFLQRLLGSISADDAPRPITRNIC